MTILKSPECRKTFLPEFDPKEAAVLQSFKYVARDANGKIFRGVGGWGGGRGGRPGETHPPRGGKKKERAPARGGGE